MDTGINVSMTVFLKNDTDGQMLLRFYHANSSNGLQSAVYNIPPFQTAGPFRANFQILDGAVPDFWSVYANIQGGSTPGQFVSWVSYSPEPFSKECMLEHGDVGTTKTFTVNSKTFTIDLESGGTSCDMRFIGPYNPITNVFVLMLENHSFDNIFAMSGIPGITAATTQNSNMYNGQTYNVADGAPTSMPTDPGHEFPDTVEQLCGEGAVYAPGSRYPPINNSGFAANYATSADEDTGLPTQPEIGDVMACFNTPGQLPVMLQVARSGMICDHWFSSLPGPTWPNRFFLHGASSEGIDYSPSTAQILAWESVHGFEYPHGSIFDAMDAHDYPWKLYYDSMDSFSADPSPAALVGLAQVAALKNISATDTYNVTELAGDVQNIYPYRYTFIEPNYGDVIGNTYQGGSSHHPMDDPSGAENLLAYVCRSIFSSPLGGSSMLIVTYDEHGGFYDSVPPPPCVAPADYNGNGMSQYGFTFEQLGVRVPAMVVSPYINSGSVEHMVYDHTSVLKTLEDIMGLNNLTRRDQNANSILSSANFRETPGAIPTLDFPESRPTGNTRKPLSAEEQAAEEAMPLTDRGNSIGFLGIAVKTDIELSAGTPADKAAILARVKAIKTRGEARAYMQEVRAKADAVREAKRKKR